MVFNGTILKALSPFVAYYSQNEMTQHNHFVVTSDFSKQDTVAMQLFQSKLHSYLHGKLADLTKITIFLMALPHSIKSSAIIKFNGMYAVSLFFTTSWVRMFMCPKIL